MEEKSLKEECRLDENVIIEIPWRVIHRYTFLFSSQCATNWFSRINNDSM